MEIKIANVVGTGDTNEEIDLEKLSKLKDTIYNPEKYRCVYLKDHEMSSKVSIFPSGKMISVGSKSEEAAKHDISHVISLLREDGLLTTNDFRFELRNVVITVNLERKIDLETIQESIPGIVYEPEQFPGAIAKPEKSDATVLIFSSGKLVIAGLKTSESLSDIVQNILQELNL